MARTLLAIHAHPDDESSKAAATVARYVDEGVRSVLVTATGGEAGDILNPVMNRPEIVANLDVVRQAELAEAARIIGYDDVVLLGYRDSGMPDSPDNARPEALCNQDESEVLGALVAVVREVKPDVVLGYDSHEFYPHPDHLYVHRLSQAVFDAAADESRFEDAGDPWQIKKVYAPVFTSERLRALHDAMIELTGESPYAPWLERMDGLELPDRNLMRFDVTGYIEQGRDALRAHRTQIDPDGFWFQVPTEMIEAVYPWEDFELLHSAVGWSDEESNLFDGIQ